MLATYAINEKHNGVEITFNSKPDDTTRESLKALGFRWLKPRRLWYAKRTESRLQFAESLAQLAEGATIPKAEPQRTQLTEEYCAEAMKAYTFEEDGTPPYDGWTGCNAQNKLYGAELKSAIIAELKKYGIKATGRTHKGSMVHAFTFTITVPEECQQSEADFIDYMQNDINAPHLFRGYCWASLPEGGEVHIQDLYYSEKYKGRIDEIELFNIKKMYKYAFEAGRSEIVKPWFNRFVERIINSFNSDHSDSYTDYFDRGFYEDIVYKF